MKLYNLVVEDSVATYTLEENESLPEVRSQIKSQISVFDVLRFRVRPNLPYPEYTKEPIYMYVEENIPVETLLEQKEKVESHAHVIRDQETLLEDFMFGITRDGYERIPFRLDCKTYPQFNINGTNIDVTVICNTVDFIVPSEWKGDKESLLEKVENLLIKFGFNRGFGQTPEINIIRI